MQKVCEFCKVLQPVIYCTADAAFLCLSCDAKVHSANAVSNRHFRTLLCEVCRNQPSCVRCLEHRMVMCHSCDRAMHEVIPRQHETRSISSYAGCPSANHFAKLWGFNVTELDSVPVVDQMSCNSCSSQDSYAVNMNRMGLPSSVIGGFPLSSPTSASVITSESFASSSSRRRKAAMKKHPLKKTSMIMQQILDLRRLQGSSTSSVIRHEGKLETDSSLHKTPENLEEFPDHCSDDLPSPVVDLEKADSLDQELNGDPFWQCRSPCGNNQFWSQNLQELGICEKFDSFDDLSMPGVDGSFCDFEDLFGAADQNGNSMLLDHMDASWASTEKDATADTSESSYSREREIHKPIAVSKDAHPYDKGHLSSRSMDSLLDIQRSSSASISMSCLDAGNTSNHCLDSEHSGISKGGKPSNACIDMKSKGSVLKRCKGRRTARPHVHCSHKQQVELALNKGKAETHKRSRGD